MKVIKRIIAVIMAVSMLSISVYAAGIYDIENKTEFADENASITDKELTSVVDNSDLQVKVTKQIGNESINIFSGKLKDYDNGKWINTDFNEIQFLVVFDWDGSEDEAIYIIPQDDDNIKEENSIDLLMVESENDSQSYEIKQAIIKNANDVIIHECTANGKVDSVTLIKKTSAEKPATLYAALYDEDGKLGTLKSVNIEGKELSGTELNCDVDLPFGNIDENHYVKIMLWEGNDGMRPLVDAYDTRIVTTDYVYSNTIMAVNQIDEYSFTVSQDGYYNIEFYQNSNITASVFNNDNLNRSIAEMSSDNFISCPLVAGEIYTLMVKGLQNGLYLFSIKQTQIPNSNILAVGNAVDSKINAALGIEQFAFTPDMSAYYDFYVDSSEFYPILSVAHESGDEIKYEDNLTYRNSIFVSTQLEANEKYIVTVKSRGEYQGSFSIIPRRIKVEYLSNDTIKITGKFNNTSNKKVGIFSLDSDDSIEYMTQTTSTSTGDITATVKINSSKTGKHTIIINSEDSISGISYVIADDNSLKKNYDFWDKTDISGLSATITYSDSSIKASTTVTSKAEINNVSSEAKIITVYNILYDSTDNIVEFSSISDVVAANDTKSIEKQKTMPETISGYKWRTFVWLGSGTHNSALRPICLSKEINSSGISTISETNEFQQESTMNVFSIRGFTLNNEIRTLNTSDLINNIDIDHTTLGSDDEERNGKDIEYTYKIKHNGVYYSTIMPGTNEIEFYFKNTGSNEVSFVPYVWLISINDNTLTEKYIQLGDYITLAPGEGTTTPWVHSMVLEDDYNLQLLYGDMLDLLFYMDFKGIIRFIPYVETVTPLVFNKSDNGKFIYCNNPEAINAAQLSDNPTVPQLLLSEKGTAVGNYSLMAEHNNQVEQEVFLDVQFFSGNYAKIKINSLGVQRPDGVSWACAEAYSDYMQLNFAKNSGYDIAYFDENMAEFELDSSNSSVWLSDLYEAIYNKAYPILPAKNGDYYRCVYIILDFEIISGAADINIAAYRDRNNHSDYCDDGTYYWDRMHKGVSDKMPFVYSNLVMSFSDSIPDGTELPVRVFNSYNTYGFQTNYWITNLNPQSDVWAYNQCTESDMLGFVYNDGKKSWYYGEGVSESKKDSNWYFDTIHGDNKMPVVSKTWIEKDTGGYWQYETSDEIPSNYKPNDILSLSSAQSNTQITSFDLACSLGNYSVQTVYNLVLINLGENTRRFEYWLNTNSNNMIYVYKDNSSITEYFAKGENNGDQRMTYIDIPPMSIEYMTIMEVLPTGNSGGMNNRFVLTSVN